MVPVVPVVPVVDPKAALRKQLAAMEDAFNKSPRAKAKASLKKSMSAIKVQLGG